MRQAEAAGRIGAVDAARGAAVVGMVVFHAAWDLRFFALIAVDPIASPAWRAFGHTVACAFLFLSGLGVALAWRNGSGLRHALRRLATVAAAALAVTLATYLVMPDAVILFGILHCIVVGNAVALALVRAPAAAGLGLGVGAVLLPLLVPGSLSPSLWWIGLSAQVPETLDMRPVFPWIAPILFGLAAGPHFGPWLTARGARVRTPRWLRQLGRHSLSIYLIHQPLMIGVLTAATGITMGSGQPLPSMPAAAGSFVPHCEAECAETGVDALFCHAACTCALTASLKRPAASSAELAAFCASEKRVPAGPAPR